MGDRFDDNWLDDSFGAEEGDVSLDDPFDGLTRRDQDIFFKVLDMIPDDRREVAMDYFLDHPQKIRAVVAGVKLQKQMIKDRDVAGLNKLFEQEHLLFEGADIATVVGMSNTDSDDSENWG